MTKFNTRIVTAIATAAVVLGAVAPAAFASTSVTVGGNGAGSNNSVGVTNVSSSTIIQSNNSTVVTSVNSTASTGGNNASFNTGSDTSVTSGDANSTVNVGVGGSSNAAVVTDPKAGPTKTTVTVTGNGAGSKNNVGVTNSSWFTAIQNNWSSIVTAVTSVTKTGKNTSSFNTDGSTTVTSGGASSNVNVNVTGSSNTLIH